MKYLVLVFFYIFVAPCQMKEACIRLIGSSLQYAGQVQIKINGSQWTSICAVGWDIKDAEVVCRQLNHLAAEAAISGEAFGRATGEVYNKEFNCIGNEGSLSQCPTEIKNVTCHKDKVAAVLCKPNDLFPLFILISLVGCLALTSIAILIITWKAMLAGKKRCPAKEREIGLSNANIERDIEVCSSTEDKRELKGGREIYSSGSYSDFEDVENIRCRSVESVNTNNKKKQETPISVSNAELIESISSLEARHSDSDQEGMKRKESRKGKYMSLLKGSRAFLHFYEKLLKRNKNRQSATDIDYALDYYSSDQFSKDWPRINDIDISSDEEYHEIYPEEQQDQEKVDKDKDDSQYVPMLSLSIMHSEKPAESEETQEEYLNILPPVAVGKEKSSPGSGNRDSDYLHPVEADLPAFPETSDNMASSSYDEELPQPPQDLATLARNHQDNKKHKSASGPLGLSHQRCRCEEEKDLLCKNCLDCHVNQNIFDQEMADELEYESMDHCSSEKNKTTVKENLRRNSAGYTISMKLAQKNKKEYGSFPELNKNNLNRKIKYDTFQSCDKELVPNKEEKLNPAAKGVTKEKGHKGLTSPRNARTDEILCKEKSPHPEKTAEPDVTATPSFSRTKDFFENNKTVANSLDKTKKKAAFSKRESELTGKPIPTSSTAGKPRSESCPVDDTNGVKPSTSFIAALENALKAREGTEGISERDEKEKEMNAENEYELDYEDIHSSSDEPKYENNDLSSGSRPGSYEYDYVHEKHRKSLHFYEAVSKQSEESEEDQYEKI